MNIVYTRSAMENEQPKIINSIAQTIYDKKGMNILVLDIRDLDSIADFAIIAEGNVDRHVTAIARAIQETLSKEDGVKPYHIEGLQEGDWVVLDYVDVMVHIFMPGLRDRYQLETLWRSGKIVDVEIKLDLNS